MRILLFITVMSGLLLSGSALAAEKTADPLRLFNAPSSGDTLAGALPVTPPALTGMKTTAPYIPLTPVRTPEEPAVKAESKTKPDGKKATGDTRLEALKQAYQDKATGQDTKQTPPAPEPSKALVFTPHKNDTAPVPRRAFNVD